MDQRIEELKQLKKAYRRALWRRTWIWRVLAALFLLAAAAFGLVAAVPEIPEYICRMIPGLAFLLQEMWAVPAGLDCMVLFFLCCLGSVLAGRKVYRSGEYLDYRTLKNTLKAEKKEKE